MIAFRNFHKKIDPHIEIIHKSARKQYPWCAKLTNILVVVIIVGATVWSVSRADDTQEPKTAPEGFSFSAIVSGVSDNSFSINNVKGGYNVDVTSYTFDVGTVKKIETNMDVPIQLSDIQIGDKIVVQGIIDNDDLFAQRIIDFTPKVISTTTEALATTTPEISTTTATTTDETSSSTATTTPSFIDNVYNAVADTIQNIVDAITGTTTPDATTTNEIVTENTSTTTEEVVIDETPTTTPEAIPEIPPVPETPDTQDTSTSTENNN